jgi:hypothetical protein
MIEKEKKEDQLSAIAEEAQYVDRSRWPMRRTDPQNFFMRLICRMTGKPTKVVEVEPSCSRETNSVTLIYAPDVLEIAISAMI